MSDECERLLRGLGDGELKSVALVRMEGYTVEEIAEEEKRGRESVRQAMSVRDEGGPLGVGLRRQAPNHRKRLESKAPVVSVPGKGAA